MKSGSDSTLVVVQTLLPRYRRLFFEQLGLASRRPVTVVLGDGDGGSSQPGSGAASSVRLESITTNYLAGGRLLWQPGALPPATAAEAVVLELNPRILSNWLILFLRAPRDRRTILWGHAWSRSGQGSWTNRLRGIMLRMADGVILYTETDRQELLAKHPQAKAWSANNAIFSASEIAAARMRGKEDAFLVSGRLIEEKKPGLAVKALAELDRSGARLIFIGDGQKLDEIREVARRLGVADQVEFLGEVFDHEDLRAAYERCIASISAGYVGLSMTQSHAFGLPMLYPDNEPHAPEVEAAEEGVNAVTFRSDDPTSLASAMREVIDNRDEWIARRESISDACRANYSIERMVAGFLAAVDGEPMEE